MRLKRSLYIPLALAMLMLSSCGMGWGFGKRKYTPGRFIDMPASVPIPDRNEVMQTDTRKKSIQMLPQRRSTLRPAFDMNITGPVLRLYQIKQLCAPRHKPIAAQVLAFKPIVLPRELQSPFVTDTSTIHKKKGVLSIASAGSLVALTAMGTWLVHTNPWVNIATFNFLSGLIAPLFVLSIILAIIAIARKDKYYWLAIAVLLFNLILLLLYDAIFMVIALSV
jgi:hypothetical protein